MIIPELVEYAREYFGCPTLDGLELEDEGERGSKISHWERRIIEYDIMIAEVKYNVGITNFTRILLESSGWYRINHQLAHNNKWGYKSGCAFINQPCIQ